VEEAFARDALRRPSRTNPRCGHRHGAKYPLLSEGCRGDWRDIELSDDHVDSVVSAFVFCNLSDQDRLAALRELGRVCKPDGTIRILDYTMSERPIMRLVMQCCEPWFRWMFNATYQVRFEEFAGLAGVELTRSRFVVGDYVRISEFRPLPIQAGRGPMQPTSDETSTQAAD
jgi:SAM-dependent methyltransferase